MVNEGHSKEDEEVVKDGREGGQNESGATADVEEYNPNSELRRWLECINAVSEITRLNWSQVFEITALEFFAYLAFYNYMKRKEQRMRDEEFRKMKSKIRR